MLQMLLKFRKVAFQHRTCCRIGIDHLGIGSTYNNPVTEKPKRMFIGKGRKLEQVESVDAKQHEKAGEGEYTGNRHRL
ncbi:MAG TPA: hypothetical protein DCR02_07340 [Sphaerochaeta sp.]|nr:hypothetical protein [Sphaerochaeta sp.]